MDECLLRCSRGMSLTLRLLKAYFLPVSKESAHLDSEEHIGGHCTDTSELTWLM
jgi:hypothetical protein